MPRVKLVHTQYTQINTIEDSYLIQNMSKSSVDLIVASSQPDVATLPDFTLLPLYGIGHSDVAGLVWGKTSDQSGSSVGLVEG